MESVLKHSSFDLIITDPPYGISRRGGLTSDAYHIPKPSSTSKLAEYGVYRRQTAEPKPIKFAPPPNYYVDILNELRELERIRILRRPYQNAKWPHKPKTFSEMLKMLGLDTIDEEVPKGQSVEEIVERLGIDE